MNSGYLFLDASDEPARRKQEAVRRMIEDTRPRDSDNRTMRYIDDLMRVLAQRSSFGIADHGEGLINSLMYGVPVKDAMQVSRARTEGAQDRLGPVVGRTAGIAGDIAGYATALPRLPAWLAGRAMVTPAAIPLEASRGYLEDPRGVGDRLRSAGRAALDPQAWLNPTTGRGLAATTFFDPAMQAAGAGDLSPRSYFDRFFGER